MFRQTRVFVSRVLPLLPLTLLQACSGGSPAADAPVAQIAVPAPTVPADGNRAPTINGVGDEYARVGETYAFQPVAGDADGDVLKFTAANLPPWASIDPVDGRITGTPGPTDAGVYESITIAVADARRETVTKPFSITVVSEAATGVASLRWETPPSKMDGSPLDDLAGYRILYGRSSEDLDHSVLINDPSITSYEISSLTSGIWYFAVVAVNANGLEGPPTITATKSI
jgi:hypothetical protein